MKSDDAELESAKGWDFAEFMRQEQAAITEDWLQQAKQQPQAQPLSRPTLIDHIPQLLECIAAIAEGLIANGHKELPDAAAGVHAIHRLGVGFDLAAVVNEFVLLRSSILRRWEGVCAASEQQEGVRALNQAIDKAIMASVQHYTQAQHRTLEALERVSAAALESPSLETFLERLLRAFLNTVSTVDTATIFLVEGELLRVRAAVGLDEGLSSGFTVRLGEGFAGQLAVEQEPLLLRADEIQQRVKSRSLREHGLQSLYGIPLLDGGQLIGVVHVGSLSAPDFSEQDRHLLKSMAARATAAILQHVLRTSAELRARQQSAIARLEAFGLASDDLQQTLDKAVALIADVLEVDLARIEQLLPDGSLLLQAQNGSRLANVSRRQPEPGTPEEQTLQTCQPAVVQDSRTDAELSCTCLLQEHPILSCAAVVVQTHQRPADDRPYGIIVAYSRQQHSFGQEDVLFLQTIGNIVAGAIIRSQASTALRDSEERLRLAMAVAKLGTFDWDLTNDTINWSKRVREIFSLSAQELITRAGRVAHIHPDDRARTLRLIDESMDPASGGDYLDEYRVLPADGSSERWVSAQGKVFFSPDGVPQRFIGVVKDITATKYADLERESLLRELEEGMRFREDILAIVSHDLRTPLTAIKMSAALLARRALVGGDNRMQQQLETIQRAGNRMEHLISDLLDMANIQSGQLAIENQTCSSAELLDEALEFHAPVAAAKEVKLEMQVSLAAVDVCCDHDRIQQVLSNLLGNAIKFCSKGDSINVCAECEGDHVSITIADTGPGIAAEELAHIFEPYWSARQHAGKGTGLGLFITKGIVEAHGGRIWAESTLGQGSAFHFTLPIICD